VEQHTNHCNNLKTNTTMKTIIFKSEKKAKIYKEIVLTSEGIYSKGEVIRIVKTDKIENLTNGMYQTTFEEVK